MSLWAEIFDQYSIPLKDGTFYINYPCFHPGVSCYLQRYPIVESKEQFVNLESNLKNPSNVDAAVCYINDRKTFWRKNVALWRTFKNGTCSVCSEPFNNGELIWYPCHMFHRDCVPSSEDYPHCGHGLSMNDLLLKRNGVKRIKI